MFYVLVFCPNTLYAIRNPALLDTWLGIMKVVGIDNKKPATRVGLTQVAGAF